MADIDVERRGPSIWPWIIGLIVLALLIWLLAEWLGDDDEVVTEEPVPAVVAPPATETAPAPALPMAEDTTVVDTGLMGPGTDTATVVRP